MKKFDYTITDPVGIHARPAGLLVKEAGGFASKITIEKNGRSADAKKIFSIMSLGVKTGETISVSAEGDDEEQAIQSIESFLKSNL